MRWIIGATILVAVVVIVAVTGNGDEWCRLTEPEYFCDWIYGEQP